MMHWVFEVYTDVLKYVDKHCFLFEILEVLKIDYFLGLNKFVMIITDLMVRL